MIRSFGDGVTRDIWNGVNSKAARRIPQALWQVVRRKLDQIDAVTRLEDLRTPPGNRLHALTDDLAGYHAIRVNDQYRVVFRFEGQDAHDARCADYH
ncbi:MAG: type II toxin-antitoxin system RelE/ParE family toxin [Bryobacterales bacterium]|nr:type II toxin-antitoxin system RelE/ParE family toxin [Bryobacterales bacterium]